MALAMKVVVAPNAFKGTLTATQAARAIARGVREVFPDAEVIEVPVADGGDGTVEALVTANRGQYLTAQVEGPLGDPVTATYGRIGSGAVVELAAASGLTLIQHERRDPRRASTFGFGQLLLAARRPDTVRLIVGIGGSATNDGGAGMAQALGYRLLDRAGREIGRGGAALAELARIDASGVDPAWRSVEVRVACDVRNPLTGPEGARNGKGTYAEYVVVKETEAALKPRSLDHIHAAAIPVVALTAWQALFDKGGLNKGQKVLIHGAAGGVGSFAVQLAKWKGAHVIGTASGRNQAFLRELGVDEPINYEKVSFEDVVHDVDVVLDTLGGDTQNRSWKVLKKGGILVSIVAPPSVDEAAKHGVRSVFFSAHPSSAQLSEIAKLVDAGKLKPVVETVLPLSEARRAHELNETGHARGKIVLKVA